MIKNCVECGNMFDSNLSKYVRCPACYGKLRGVEHKESLYWYQRRSHRQLTRDETAKDLYYFVLSND